MTKYLYLPLSLSLLAVASCRLENDPDIPTGVNNQIDPVISSVEVTAISDVSIRAEARLTELGNLLISNHGWVWDTTPLPTLENKKLEFGSLYVNYFADTISDLEQGKTYYLRPFVITPSDTIYGEMKTILKPRIDSITELEKSPCRIRIRFRVTGPKIEAAGVQIIVGNTIRKVKGTGPDNDNFYMVEVTGLTPDSTYPYLAYAITEFDWEEFSNIKYVTVPSATSLPLPQFTINTDAEIFNGARVQFANTSDTSGAPTFFWDFGDGGASIDKNPVYEFDSIGTWTVHLTVESGGCTITDSMIIKVVPDPFSDYWVEVPGGNFTMGCDTCMIDEEKPAHPVSLNTFFIGKTEITQAQWLSVVDLNPSTFPTCMSCPVEYVSRIDIDSVFLKALFRKTGRQYHLPTEAQWEYAARGGPNPTNTLFAGSNNLEEVGWYVGNSSTITHKVASIPLGVLINSDTLFDMSGNVSEWVEDYWHDDYTNAPDYGYPAWLEDPPNGDLRVIRGGSYASDPSFCRVYARFRYNAFQKRSDIGFRLVRAQ